jgi:hypothetical protein
MQARRKTKRTASAGVGTGVGFIGSESVRLHGSIFELNH